MYEELDMFSREVRIELERRSSESFREKFPELGEDLERLYLLGALTGSIHYMTILREQDLV